MNYQLPTVQNSVSATRRWKSVCVPIVLAALLIATVNTVHAQKRLIDHFPDAAQSGCMACHSEVEPILRPSTVVGAIAHCLVKDVQEFDEEEFEALVAAAQQFKWNFGGTQVDISATTLRQLLTTMHIHGSPDSAIVLRDSLTMLCESKTEDLRKFLAAQLQPITPDRSLFRAASAKKDGSKSKSKVRPMYQPAPRPAEDIDPKPQP